uniref:Uncharacterized protein n=1 Tax=Timema genevievae TaxID=629358 RepID=A0A7R9PNF6_TIMGE|nr:unnamed protein product [Timema genevievae]
MASIHRETIQKQIQQDWANREYIEVITGSIKKITDFLNSFGKTLHLNDNLLSDSLVLLSHLQSDQLCFKQIDMSCRSRLAVLNEKLTTLERRVEYLEARVTKGETLT